MKIFYTIFCALLSEFLLTIPSLAQCSAPTNQPSNVVVSSVTADGAQIDFTAATAAPGEVKADQYLVVYTTDNSVPTPINGQTYITNGQIGTGQVCYIGPATTCTVTFLISNTKYTFYIFSMSNAGNCYNLLNPAWVVATTKASDGSVNTNNGNQTTDQNNIASKLAPLLNFNFAGKQNSWSNLTPVVYYGWTISGRASIKKSWKPKDGNSKYLQWGSALQIGPYIGSTINIKDSTSYLPALMLPGNAGLEINYFLTFGNEKKFSIVVSPVNFGLKVISGFTDSSVSLVQHSIRHAIGIRYADYVTFSVQYTQGWHSITSQSDEYYKKLFPNTPNKMRYWNLTLTTRLSDNLFNGNKTQTPLYLSINWRSLVNPSLFGNLPNSRFLTVGIIANLDLKSGSNPGFTPKMPPNP